MFHHQEVDLGMIYSFADLALYFRTDDSRTLIGISEINVDDYSQFGNDQCVDRTYKSRHSFTQETNIAKLSGVHRNCQKISMPSTNVTTMEMLRHFLQMPNSLTSDQDVISYLGLYRRVPTSHDP